MRVPKEQGLETNVLLKRQQQKRRAKIYIYIYIYISEVVNQHYQASAETPDVSLISPETFHSIIKSSPSPESSGGDEVTNLVKIQDHSS